MSAPKKKTKTLDSLKISVNIPSLSAGDLSQLNSEQITSEVKTNIYNSIHNAELQTSILEWTQKHHTSQKIVERDWEIVRSMVGEYMDTFMLFGYDSKGDRVLVSNFLGAKDQDAMMEFFNFLHYKFSRGEAINQGPQGEDDEDEDFDE